MSPFDSRGALIPGRYESICAGDLTAEHLNRLVLSEDVDHWEGWGMLTRVIHRPNYSLLRVILWRAPARRPDYQLAPTEKVSIETPEAPEEIS
ncbi:hypothetical protein B8281_16025 [Cellulosimicrobium sp. TH-20]|uniref:hypothetical protein n=1 Tax=Cellulosimicrobium sp. TH-20 TaxID=1980001 RepID=UPI000A17FC2D|nr:hypothetical protein [Cellulosimicrobium sp. TH-20]ARK06000.1 hypothetical protein B8281_16025 [Cellulosimicrobium sp. TH-20]